MRETGLLKERQKTDIERVHSTWLVEAGRLAHGTVLRQRLCARSSPRLFRSDGMENAFGRSLLPEQHRIPYFDNGHAAPALSLYLYSMPQEPAAHNLSTSPPTRPGLKPSAGVDREIVIARDGDRYRLLHGQLRLATRLGAGKEICVDSRDEGIVKIVKARGRLLVESGNRLLPLYRNE